VQSSLPKIDFGFIGSKVCRIVMPHPPSWGRKIKAEILTPLVAVFGINCGDPSERVHTGRSREKETDEGTDPGRNFEFFYDGIYLGINHVTVCHTVKKGFRYSRPQLGCHLPNSL
jgi:hypothetical protein